MMSQADFDAIWNDPTKQVVVMLNGSRTRITHQPLKSEFLSSQNLVGI